MKIPGRELAIAVVWLAIVGGAFAAFYFLAGPGARRAPEAREEKTTPPGTEKAPPPGPDVSAPDVVTAEPRRIFADAFKGKAPGGWEAFGASKTITLERADGVLRLKGASGSLDWDVAGLRTRAYELDRFSASVEFRLVSNEGTGTKMFFLCAEDPERDDVRAWVYFHPTRGARESPGFAAMKEGGSAKTVGAPDGGKASHTLRLSYLRGKLAAFVDSEKLAAYEMKFKKVRFALGMKSPAKGERVEAAFDSFLLLDRPDRSFEP